MSKGKYTGKTARKSLVLLLAVVLLIGCVAGGTLAWLTAKTTEVTNVFTTSDISVELKETTTSYQMIPGWTISKDPKVTVSTDSEDCWLFVKVTESTSPDLDSYIAYAIAAGWTTYKLDNDTITAVDSIADLDTIILARQVKKTDTTKTFGILGAGTYNVNSVNYTWANNEVLTKPEVTKEMMAQIGENNKPTLSFTAYAVQLWKSNESGGDSAKFTPAEAWALAAALPETN